MNGLPNAVTIAVAVSISSDVSIEDRTPSRTLAASPTRKNGESIQNFVSGNVYIKKIQIMAFLGSGRRTDRPNASGYSEQNVCTYTHE